MTDNGAYPVAQWQIGASEAAGVILIRPFLMPQGATHPDQAQPLPTLALTAAQARQLIADIGARVQMLETSASSSRGGPQH